MSKYHNAFQGFVKVFTGAAKPGVKGNPTTIVGVAPSKNIKKFQEQKEKILKTTDKYKAAVNDPEVKKKMSSGTSKTLSNISKIYKGEPITKKVKKVEKKAKGGRIGLKGGGSDMGSTTNKSINSLKNFLEDRKNRKKSNISDKADRAKKAFDMIQTNLNTDFKTMNRTQDSKGRFKDRKSMRKYIDDVSTASTRDSAKVRIGRKFGSKPKTNVEKIKETFAPKKSGNVPSKFKGFSKLPEAVQQKMNKKLARKV
jgi:hypothetical protein